MTPLEQRRVCIAPSSIESPRRPLRAPPRRSRERGGARPIYRGAETASRPLVRFAMDASHRLLQTNTFQAPYGLFDSPLREEDSVDAASLASVIAFLSPRSPLPSRAERESSAPPFASGFPERDQNRWRLRGSLWITCLVSPSADVAFRVEACSAPSAFGGDTSGTLVTRASVAGHSRLDPRASVAPSRASAAFGPRCLRS